MNRKRLCAGLILVLILPVFLGSSGIDIHDTKMLSDPAASRDHIAFVYAEDLWVAKRDGSEVRRLTSDEGVESHPVFSPNGKWIAFNAEYDGNYDVFFMSVEGGIPTRLTWHPGGDVLCDFTPDGSGVLFRSSRFSRTGRQNQLYTLPVEGGFPQKLEIPFAFKAVYSPDGKYLAYVPLREAFRQWKHYRGGTVSTIHIYSFEDQSVVKIQQPEGRCNDTDPIWMGSKIFFISDRNGEFNLFSYDINSEAIEALTDYDDFPIIKAAGGDGCIIYERAGHLFVYDIAGDESQRLRIGIATDLAELRPRYISGFRYLRDVSLSPSGARAALEFRGEILTVPAKKGDPRYLTRTPGIHERTPAWSPDGKFIAYFSDASGEYALHILAQDGREEAKAFKLSGAGFYSKLTWSPDSKKLSFTDNARNFFWMDVESGKITKIAQESIYFPGTFGLIRGAWSPDSRWIAYTLHTESYIQRVYIYSLEQNRSFPVTDGLSEVSEPIFDEGGKYMYFFASTDAGPVKHWFAMSNADMESNQAIYLVTLQADTANPLAKESDEEKAQEKPEKKEKQDEKTKKEDEDKDKNKDIQIDFDGIQNCIIALPIGSGSYSLLDSGKTGTVYYLESGEGQNLQGRKLHKFDLKSREDKVILSGVNGYAISGDNEKIIYSTRNSLHITELSDKIKPGDGRVDIDAVQIRIDPRAEWRQIFHEAWRINRDYFYDPNYHGADWVAMRKKYEAFLPHLACRTDLNRLIQWMCSELAVGHHRVGGGDFYEQPERVPGGLLGADYEIANGRYRFKKVFGGLNWNPRLQSPLKQPGVDVKTGEYLLAVNGRELKPPENLFSRFENTAGKIVEITVGPDPDGSGSRDLKVVPISSEGALRNRDWVERNIEKVDKATNGRVAYVYVPNTAGMGHVYFKRYFFPQVHKQAIIIDERFNGGGSVADYYIDILRRPYICSWAMRYGRDLITPSGAIQGPKVMLINESAGSGGDLLPWMFRKLKLGKLIGKRTWGGLVGTLGFPTLLDGGRVTAPNLAFWTEEDGFAVENEGVPPDIEVEQAPAEVAAGHDPQLEKAIEVILKELEANPPKKPKRPPYPVRVKKK